MTCVILRHVIWNGNKEIMEMEVGSTEMGFPGGAVVKNLLANAGDTRDTGFHPWVRKIAWSREWQPTLVFLPGESYGQRSLAGSMGSQELDTTEVT